jgi:hypothetical protein
MSIRADVLQVKERHKEAVLNKPNVVGVGTGYKVVGRRRTDEMCVVVLVRQKVPSAGLDPQAMVPPGIEGVPTDVIQVGDLRAMQAPTDRWRPARGGVSIGHYKVTAGTFGVIVRDRATDDRLILSNNHVLANSNDANLGDPIIQPGAVDGGRVEDDTIAHLERFQPITFGLEPPECSILINAAEIANALARLLGSSHRLNAIRIDLQAFNLVDAAVARPVNDEIVLDEILEIGQVTGTKPASLGMAVRKSGRTTGFTMGEITVLDATVNVNYGSDRVARFENQIVTGPMSQGGDSGSLLVAGDSPHGVGLLFAGSDQATIYNPIQEVLETLSVTL